MKKSVPSEMYVREASELVSQLEKALPKILSQKIWEKRIPSEDKIAFLQSLTKARRSLFDAAERQVPELKGRTYMVGTFSIDWEVPDEEEKFTEQ